MDKGEVTDRFFAQCIKKYAAEKNYSIASYSHDWIHELSSKSKSAILIGHDVGLNSASVYQLCKDKSATTTILTQHAIPCVQHELCFAPGTPYAGTNDGMDIQSLFVRFSEDVVVKPNNGGAGIDVYHCRNTDTLFSTTSRLFATYRTIALSPFVHAHAECRLTVLNGHVIHAYKKIPKEGEFRLNLAHGAQVVPFANNELQQVSELAVNAAACVGARFVNVDILLTDASPLVLEINGTVSFQKYATIEERYARDAYIVYTKALDTLFN